MTWIAALALTSLMLPALGLVRPRLRPAAALLLLAGTLALLLLGWQQRDQTSTLVVKNAFAAFVEHEIESREFTIETVTAPAWRWPLVLGGFLLFWSALLWLAPRKTGGDASAPAVLRSAIAPALLLAWSGAGLVFALEKCGAPAELVGWLALEAVMLVATLCCACRLARPQIRVLAYFAWLVVFGFVVRLPLALFGTVATQRRLGTHQDVHSIQFIANPFTKSPVDLVPGSTDQITYLIWVPQLVLMPVTMFFIAGGIGFAVLMFVQHPAPAAPRSTRPAQSAGSE